MISGPQRKFCEAYALDLNGTAAYLAAYPESSAESARRSASDLLTKPDIQAEIQRIRDQASEKAGSAVLSLAEKRRFLARLVRVNAVQIDLTADGDLVASLDRIDGPEGAPGVLKIRLGDKLAAIKLDNDLAGEGAEASANDAFSDLLREIRK